MAQPKRGDSSSSAGARTTSGRARSSRSTGGSSSRAAGSGRATGKTRGSSSTGRANAASSPDARLEAAAERVRKLNERIIDAGKQAGETTLSAYETALKAIAGAVERGPGSSDIDWISQLATTQAKFIRDVTEAWTSAARDMLK